MRHRRNRTKLGRPADHRKALIRNLATSLALHGKISTTTAKAKALISFYEHLLALTRGEKESMNAIRIVKRHLFTIPAQKAFIERLKNLKGDYGWLRATKLGPRDGDGAEISQIEFVESSS
ncbi:MAG: L17 family ribosomal protein [bacterium]|nr:L17 family ribosomal protein [bacterium]